MVNLIPTERIENKIYLIRGQKVMIDRDLAELYGVTTFNLNKAVKRNRFRFPKDFMFRLNKKECSNLKFQFGISSWGGRRTLPYAFTEQGVAMLSSVLRSRKAVYVNIAIMRAFVKLRPIISTHKLLAEKLNQLEKRVGKHDGDIKNIFDAIRFLMAPQKKTKGRIGFIK